MQPSMSTLGKQWIFMSGMPVHEVICYGQPFCLLEVRVIIICWRGTPEHVVHNALLPFLNHRTILFLARASIFLPVPKQKYNYESLKIVPDNNNPTYRSYKYSPFPTCQPSNLCLTPGHLSLMCFLICTCLFVIKVFMDIPSPVKNVSDLASPSFSIAPEFLTSLL